MNESYSSFEDNRFAVIYFLKDKDFSIYHTNDIIGFDELAFSKLKAGEKLIMEAFYDELPLKVIFHWVPSTEKIRQFYIYSHLLTVSGSCSSSVA